MLKYNQMVEKIKGHVISRKVFYFVLVVVLAVFAAIFAFRGMIASDAPLITNVEFSPDLDISRFDPYNLLAGIERFSESSVATVDVSGVNGDGGNYWNYYANGQPASESITKNLSYDPGLGKWKSDNIYPDNIYPEIFFASSNLTWNNSPQNIDIRRNNYHLMHFKNPFTVTANMTFWVEINAYRKSAVNSANLDIYLVETGHDITYFQDDWRNKDGVELIGSIGKNADFHHSHTANSSHHLVALSANNSATFGTKNLSINEDFWIIAYANSPNAARGWDLRYHPSNLCENSGQWYSGNQQGWSTALQSGCPDAHIHTARRSSEGGIRDGAKTTVTATENGETGTQTSYFYYNELPNLAPNPTSFIAPTVGGTYAGDINVSWNPATDPNNDELNYSLYLLDSEGTQIGAALVDNQPVLNYSLATTTPGSEIPDGQYSLSGMVCDQGVPGNDPPDPPLCTNYLLGGNFYIDNTETIESISALSIETNNSRNSYGKNGDQVTISFVTTGPITSPSIAIFSGGIEVSDTISINSANSIDWTASYLIGSSDTDGEVTFLIDSAHLDQDYYDTTDGSVVIVDKLSPTISGFIPEDDSDNVAANSNLEIEISENVEIINNKNLVIKEISDSSIFETIDLLGEKVTLDGNSLIINPSENFQEKTTYYIVIDSGAWADLAGNQYLGISDSTVWSFTVGDFTPPELSNSKITSDNEIAGYAKNGDLVTLSFSTNEEIVEPNGRFFSGGQSVKNSAFVVKTDSNNWDLKYRVSDDSDGIVTFSFEITDLFGNSNILTVTDDQSSVVIDNTPPGTIIARPGGGVYNSGQSVVLFSDDSELIRFSDDGSDVNCDSGIIHSSPINVSNSKDIKAIACDKLHNSTEMFSFAYVIRGSKQQAESSNIVSNPEEQQAESENAVSNLGEKSAEEIKLYNLSIKVRINWLPLREAKIKLYSEPKITSTDKNGVAFFSGVPEGGHQILVNYNGVDYTKKIIVEEGNNYLSKDNLVSLNINIFSKDLIVWFVILIILIPIIILIIIFRKGIKKIFIKLTKRNNKSKKAK